MHVIYVDNHILVAVKPANLATQPHPTSSDNFLDRAKLWIKKRFNKSGNVFLEPIHRLDKPVSGLVLFARTSKALSRLQASMRKQEIHKTYIALVEGRPSLEQGTWEDFLIHASHRAQIVPSTDPRGKRACLHYRALYRKNLKNREFGKEAAQIFGLERATIVRAQGASEDQKLAAKLTQPKTDSLSSFGITFDKKITLLEISLETGRYHQIRAQCAAHGHPILGDRKYGSTHIWKDKEIALQHAKMRCNHPVSHQDLIFETPDFKEFFNNIN